MPCAPLPVMLRQHCSCLWRGLERPHNTTTRFPAVPPRSAVILAPHDTPYACGAFAFDILLPPDYPNQPPQARRCCAGQAGCKGCDVMRCVAQH